MILIILNKCFSYDIANTRIFMDNLFDLLL